MRYIALATDYDGTLAHDGRVDDAARQALERLAESGRKLILITGRELPDLERAFPHLALFDCIVAENGAVICAPRAGRIETLADGPPAEFVDELRNLGVAPLNVGRVIVATRTPHDRAVAQTIERLGLKLVVITNKDSVMVLPAGIDKASGLRRALAELRLAPEAVVGVGDAENDVAFLRLCGCSVAVDNALDAVKRQADVVTRRARGFGVIEIADRMLDDDLASVRRRVV